MPRMNKTLRNSAIFLVVIGVLGAALALDLTNRGLFWQFAWSRTGEEAPLAQVRGLVEWSVGLTRPQPRTQPMTAIQHSNVNPYGINTFLEQEADPAKVDEQLRMIADAGFVWIRQQFEWAELEVDGPGQYTDNRNDLDGDGEPDTISAWIKYDNIVENAERYGLQIQVRLDNPPLWSRTEPVEGTFGPPDDLQQFVDYAATVAARYQGRLYHYQVWNEPNLGFEWGGRSVDPERYTEMLCRTYDALKAVDPDIVVITGAMAPTIDLSGYNLMDFIFLQRMYDAGAADCFDVLSVQGYGLFSGPTDERLNPMQVNIGRNRYMRDIMVANGDAHKPIWISEAAWNAVPSEAEYPDPIAARYAFGQVTEQQQADYAVELYQRAQQEWPWVGVVNYWFFTRASDRESDQSFYYFRMVEPDYSDEKPSFTPLPVYDAMRGFIMSQQPTLYMGTHQAAGHWAIQATDGESIPAQNGRYDKSLRAASLTFTAHGTDVTLRWRGAVALEVNGRTYPGSADGWNRTTLHDTLTPQTATFTITAQTPVEVNAVVVQNRPFEKIVPLAVPLIVGVVMLLIALGAGLRERRR
jgi:polysaccharide biosynthesis protein PslG